jgi:subtilisin family serine protease
MGWFGNQSRRKNRRPHRLVIEQLDDRCLLSTTATMNVTSHLTGHELGRRQAIISNSHHRPVHGERTGQLLKRIVVKSQDVERPAGNLASGATTAYDPIINAAATRSTYNVNGSGMSVAVIDTGVDYNNAAFGGAFGPNDKVIAGYDFADNTADPMATTSQHGTAIAGLIGSSNSADLGVAPGVNIVALRVTDNSNTASLTSIANALQWVINNHSEYNITSVNMSLSDGGNYAQNWFANDGGSGQRITELVGQLTSMNIPVVAAAGNSFNGQQGEGFSAIVAGTISVTATDLSGNLLANAQRLGSAIGGASATTIAAPGEGLAAPSGDSGISTVEGTSFATALVTGGVTLLQQIYQSRFGTLPTVTQIESWMQQSATPIHDSVTGITLGELNLQAAAAMIPNASPAPTTPVVATPAPASSPTPPATPPAVTVTPDPSTLEPATTQVATSPASNASQPSTTTTTAAPTSPASNASQPSTATTTATATSSNVQFYFNGQRVDISGSKQTSTSSTNDLSYLEALFASLSSGTTGGSGQGTTQVQIWNA